MTASRFTIPAAVAAILLASSTARADGSDRKAAAEALFERARELVAAHKFAEACPKFAESLELDAGLGTMLWLADCYENNGQTASAWAEFKDAASVAALKKDSREAVARRRVAALEPLLSRIVIAASAGDTRGREIKRDGVVVPPAALGVAVPVDPGPHTVVVTAPDHRPWSSTVNVPKTTERPLLIEVPALVAEGRAPAQAPAQGPVFTAVREPSGLGAIRVAGISLAVAGAAGLGAGAFFGLSAKSTLDKSNRDGHCEANNACDDTGRQLRSDAKTSATMSTIGFIAGAAAVAGGAVLFFAAPSAKDKTAVTITPSVSWQHAGVVVGRRF